MAAGYKTRINDLKVRQRKFGGDIKKDLPIMKVVKH